MSECVWGTPYFCPASGLVPLSGKIRFGASSLSKKNLRSGVVIFYYYNNRNASKKTEVSFFIVNLHMIVKKNLRFWGFSKNGGFF